ncbi:MAG: hypothetical protein KGJ94_09890 [Xanthomonadaceae bacterium]|nr:hypothetical protein [Xanthomonadaceae bacterium]
MSKVRPIPMALMLATLAGCQTAPTKLTLPAPLSVGPQYQPQQTTQLNGSEAKRTRMSIEATPTPPKLPTGISGLDVKQPMPKLTGPNVTANLDNLPLPAFIDTVYGHLLHVDYFLDPQLAKTTDLVTLRVNEPQPPATFYKVAADVLQRYGVAVQWDGHTVNLIPAKQAKGSEPPILISGSALPTVPESHRPVFQLVQLHAVAIGDVQHWMETAYANSQLKIDTDIRRNAVVLSGPESIVRQAAQAIKVLDRPFLRGSYSRRIEPAFISATDLAPRLVDALNAEGYSASTGVEPGRSIIILPIPAANSLLVFAPDQATMDHVIQWARTIDQPNPTSGNDSLFYYQVQNTKASEIAAVLNGTTTTKGDQNLTMGSNPAPTLNTSGKPTNEANAAKGSTDTSAIGGGMLRVDVPRNALIFRGEPAEWERMLPLVKQMDRPARQVMIQVTIAEVTLTNQTNYGVSWLAFDKHGRFNGNWVVGQLGGNGTTPGTGTGSGSGSGSNSIGNGGLSYLVDVAGANRAELNALASDNRVTILSTPRLLVQSGQQASINVGTQVPTLTAQTTSAQQTGGTSNLLQSVQYVNTGIILNVKPTIFSDNRIDLEVSQEVSQAEPVGTTGIQSPSISDRKVSTTLTLHDGGSVVLGGLISTQVTNGSTGVPLLKDIPLIGNLFSSHTKNKQRDELLIMIVPYIIDSDAQAKAVTQAVIDSTPGIDSSAMQKSLGPLTPAPAHSKPQPPKQPPQAPPTPAHTQGIGNKDHTHDQVGHRSGD